MIGQSSVASSQPTDSSRLTAPLALLAGGLGTRLGAQTAHCPKALVPVAGRPFLHHQLALLARRGVREVVLCTGHMSDAIEQEIGDGSRWGLCVRYSPDGPGLRGTAGALRQALPLLGDVFWVLYGDSYLDTDYLAPLNRLQADPLALGVMTVCHNRNQWDKSNVSVRDGHVLVYDKKSSNRALQHIDYGLGALRADALSEGEERDLSDVYARLARRGRLLAEVVSGRFYEIGSPAGLADTEAHLSR